MRLYSFYQKNVDYVVILFLCMEEITNTLATFVVADKFSVTDSTLGKQDLEIVRTHVLIPKMTLVFRGIDTGNGTEDDRHNFGSSQVGITASVERTRRSVELGTVYQNLYGDIVTYLNEKQFTVGQLLNYFKVHSNPRGVFPGVDLFSCTFFYPVTKKNYLNVLSYSFLDMVSRGYVPLPPYYLYKKRCGSLCKKYLKTFATKHAEMYKQYIQQLDIPEPVLFRFKVKGVNRGHRTVMFQAIPKNVTKSKQSETVSSDLQEVYYVEINTDFDCVDGVEQVYLDLVVMAYDIMTLPPPTSEQDYFSFCSILNNMLVFDWWYLLTDDNKYVSVLDKLLENIPSYVVDLIRASADDCAGGFSGVVTTMFDKKSDLSRYRADPEWNWETEGTKTVTWEDRASLVTPNVTKYYQWLGNNVKQFK